MTGAPIEPKLHARLLHPLQSEAWRRNNIESRPLAALDWLASAAQMQDKQRTMGFSNAELFSVEAVFANNTFVVPEFQRGYAWGMEQWKALWDDVKNVNDRAQGDHFAGTIMVAPEPQEQAHVRLIDGQQRLTSLSLLLRALRGRGHPISFTGNIALQTYFDYYALGQDHLAPQLSSHRSYYTRNLANAAKYFEECATKLTPVAREQLANAMLHRFKLFVLTIQPEFDVHVAFETINNRGRPLSTLERLKNRLIYIACGASDAVNGSEAAAEVHRCWQGIYRSLGSGEQLLDDDEFLRAHSVGWFKHERKADWMNSQLFDVEFPSHGRVKPERVIEYVRSLEVAAACWHLIYEPRKLPPSAAQRIESLHRVSWANFRPLMLWSMLRLAKEHRKDVFEGGNRTAWSTPLAELAREAERFIVMVVLANGRQSNIGQTDVNKAAFSLAHPGAPIYSNYPELIPPATAVHAVSFVRNHVRSLTHNIDQEGKYLQKKFPWPGHFDGKLFGAVVENRFRNYSGFYDWELGKLLIYLWELRLRGQDGAPEKKPWEKFAWDDSVEHIYPQHPHRAWQEDIVVDGRAPKGKQAITHSLGNLLLLSRSLNAANSNEPYVAIDALKGKRARFRVGSYSEVQVAHLCERWTVVQIAARGIAMMRLAQEEWDFELVSPEQPLTDWLPYLFGEMSAHVQHGDFSGGTAVDGRSLNGWVAKFEGSR